jgi:hypothetical protein
MYSCSHLSHMVNIVRFSIFQYLPNDMRACPFIHVWKYCQTPSNQINRAYTSTTSILALMKFLHNMAFSWVKSMWLQAISGFFQSWPRLIAAKTKHKHFPQLDTTTEGPMDQTRKNIRTTQPCVNQPPPTITD